MHKKGIKDGPSIILLHFFIRDSCNYFLQYLMSDDKLNNIDEYALILKVANVKT